MNLTATTLTRPFERTRSELDVLHFDPEQDAHSAQRQAVAEYLQFYRIDLSEQFPGVHHHTGWFDASDYRIACHYWLPANALGTVVVLHGYLDHSGLFGHLYRHLLDRDYAVVAFDLPGHGLSTGARASIASFDHYVEVLNELLANIRDRLPQPVSVVGQSTGGAIVLKRVLEFGWRDLHRIVALAPLVQPAHWWWNRVVFNMTHRFRQSIPRKFRDNSSDLDFLEFLEHRDPLQDRTIPMDWLRSMKTWIDECESADPSDAAATIIQGDADTTLTWRYNLRLLTRKFPAAETHIIAGAGHHLANQSPPLREQVFAAIPL